MNDYSEKNAYNFILTSSEPLKEKRVLELLLYKQFSFLNSKNKADIKAWSSLLKSAD